MPPAPWRTVSSPAPVGPKGESRRQCRRRAAETEVGADHESLSKLLLAITLSQSLISLDISNPGMFRMNAPLSVPAIQKCLRPAILNSQLQYLNLLNCGL